MQYSIAEVIELTGKSKATIYNYLNNGKLNFSLNSNNEKIVDISELSRVFPDINHKIIEEEKTKEKSNLENVVHELEKNNLELKHQIELLQNSLNFEKEKFILLESKTKLLEEIKQFNTEIKLNKIKKKWFFF